VSDGIGGEHRQHSSVSTNIGEKEGEKRGPRNILTPKKKLPPSGNVIPRERQITVGKKKEGSFHSG